MSELRKRLEQQRHNSSRWRARPITLGAALLAAAIALSFYSLAWREYETSSVLRSRGQVVMAKRLRTEEFTSTATDSSDSTRTSYRGVWSYAVNGRVYELMDRGTDYDGPKDLVPALGPVTPDQIVYLPEKPAVARLRHQLGPDNLALVMAGSFFLVIGLVFGCAGAFLLKPGE